MSLIECRECGGMVSDLATVCPHCGAPVTVQINSPEQESIEAVEPYNLMYEKYGKHMVFYYLILIVNIALFAKSFTNEELFKFRPAGTQTVMDNVSLFFLIVSLLCSATTAIALLVKSKKSYTALLISLYVRCLQEVCMIVTAFLLYQSQTYYSLWIIIPNIIVVVLLIGSAVVQFIYFRHRKFLFDPECAGKDVKRFY